MKDQEHADVELAARTIQSGGLVVFPTETVYGLGASALDEHAVLKIFRAKGRPADNPLIVHVAELEEIATLVRRVPDAARRLFAAFAPGPLTLVVEASHRVPRAVTAGLDSVAVRIPRHPLARRLLRSAGRPIAAPSANRSGEPSPTTVEMARRSLGSAVDVYLDGGPCEVGLESTVAAVSEERVVILRPGAVSADEISALLPALKVGYGTVEDNDRPASPGVRHRHYQPQAVVVACEPAELAAAEGPGSDLCEATSRIGLIGLEGDVAHATRRLPDHQFHEVRVAVDLESYARGLYRWFAELDASGVRCIIALLPPDEGIGRAIRDRLLRAAGPA
jgi:L-threonylcarbamoyladenylate synthase